MRNHSTRTSTKYIKPILVPRGHTELQLKITIMALLISPANLNVSISGDLSHWNETEPTAWPLSKFWTISFTCGLILIILLGIIGNALVIYISLKSTFDRNRNSTIDVYILHLSIADFLFLIFCVPFQGTVFILNDWPYGLTMCKLAYYCQYVTMYASIWILTLMSIDRYVAMGHPLKSVKLRTVGRATRFSAAVWVVAIVLSFPRLFLYTTVEYPEATVCYDYWNTHSEYEYRKWLILFAFTINYLLPTLIIICMALLICAALRTSSLQTFMRSIGSTGSPLMENSTRTGATRVFMDTRRRRRVVWMVFALSAWYLFCWSSHSVLLVWLNFHPGALEWIEDNSWTFFLLKIIGHMGTYIHSSLNPILYSLAHEQFRRRLLTVFGKKRELRKDSNFSGRAATTFVLDRQGLRTLKGDTSQKDESNEEFKRTRL